MVQFNIGGFNFGNEESFSYTWHAETQVSNDMEVMTGGATSVTQIRMPKGGIIKTVSTYAESDSSQTKTCIVKVNGASTVLSTSISSTSGHATDTGFTAFTKGSLITIGASWMSSQANSDGFATITGVFTED